MKINAMGLERFRNHYATELEFAPLTIVKGLNGQGKTSLLYGVEVALTGRCNATDRGGKGAADLIMTGEKGASCSVDIEGLGIVTRIIKPSGSSLQIADWTGTATAQQNLLYQKLGADADLISAVLNVSSFISLPAKEQKEMLFAIARPEISAGQLMGAVNDWAEKQAAGNLLDELRGLIQIPETVGPDWLDQAYKLIFEARKQAKKEAAGWAGRLQEIKEKPAEVLPDPAELPKLQAQIAELEKRKQDLEVKRAENAAASSRRETLARKEKDIRGDLEGMKEAEPAEAGDSETLRLMIEAASEALEKERKISYEAQGELRAIDDALPKLKKAGAACPLAPELVTCKMTADDRKALVKDLTARRKQLVAEHEQAAKRAGKLEADIKDHSRKLNEATAVEGTAREISALEKRLEEVQAELAALPEIGAGLADSEIDTLAERIRNGHELAARMKLAAESAGRAQQVLEASKEADETVVRLEALAALFGPTGIKQHLLTRTMGAVIERAAQNLSGITGGAYTLAAESDPDFHLVVNGNIELRQLSTSERMRVGIACAEALAHASGLRLLVIDDLEILDIGNRILLESWLMEKMADHDTILVLSTADNPGKPGVQGIKSYWVEAGIIRAVEAVGVGA